MMPRGPSKAAEGVVAIFLPPACREEVLGDLRELYRSPGQYAFLALRTVPLVILSRIRRTADPQVVLMQAFVMYLSFLGAAWLHDRWLLSDESGLRQLAIPVGIALLGVLLEDAYARPGRRNALKLGRGPAIGLSVALVLYRALPVWVMLYGCWMGLLLSSAVRLLFPPGADQLQGVHAPAAWLRRDVEPIENGRRVTVTLAVILWLWVAYLTWTK
ncbi:MAG: hypothetical protein P4L56_24365 [Candidatus Sulfopaludibacter sp.]|nr:hypothetical protein [Candidatus Sulfopaludibacter sp.]